MKQQVSGRTVAIVLLLVLGAIYFVYWRTLVYQPRGGPGGPGGGGAGGASGPATLAEGQAGLSVTTLAGTGVPGYRDARAGRAQFDGPSGVAVDRAGSVYVADTRNHRIRRIAPDGTVTTVAGSGPTGDLIGGFADGPAAESRFRCPAGVAATPDGTLFAADTGNHSIRRISGDRVSTVAGGGAPAAAGFADGAGAAARFRSPSGIAVDRAGNLFVADTGNAAVRKVDPAGRVTTLSRGGALQAPVGIALALDGSLLVTDPRARRAFRLAAGGTPAPAPLAFQLAEQLVPLEPGGAGVTPDGTRLVTDLARHVLFAESKGYSYLLAGVIQDNDVRTGWNDATGDRATFDHPFGLATDATGIVYVADFENHVVRRIAAGSE